MADPKPLEPHVQLQGAPNWGCQWRRGGSAFGLLPQLAPVCKEEGAAGQDTSQGQALLLDGP